jgi:hypothetical protein
MAYLDFKVTNWKRIYVPDELVEEVQNRLINGDVDTPYDLLGEEGHYTLDMGDDELCEEPMSIEENDFCSTQEIFSDDGESIWSNGKND